MKVNINVRKYKESKKIFFISFLISLILLLIIVLGINDLRKEWVSYIAVIFGALIVPLILLATYHLKYYKKDRRK